MDVGLEVGGPQLRRDVVHRLLVVHRRPGLHEGVEVDVGRVDLDAPRRLVDPQVVRHDHGERVGLLTGRAARAPQSDGLVAFVPRDDLRDDLAFEVPPRGGITEEPGEVDQDGVEERRELVDVGLEHVVVLGEGADAELVGPAANAAAQWRRACSR